MSQWKQEFMASVQRLNLVCGRVALLSWNSILTVIGARAYAPLTIIFAGGAISSRTREYYA